MLTHVPQVGLISRRTSLLPTSNKADAAVNRIESAHATANSAEPKINTAHDHKPITEADIQNALKKGDREA